MRITPCAFFVLSIVCLLPAGCGGDAPESSSPGSGAKAEIDACTLLTAAEIEAAMGVKPAEAERPNRGMNSCQWPNPDAALPVAYIGLSHHSNTSWEQYRKYMMDNAYGDPDEDGERIDIGRFGHYRVDTSMIQVFADGNRLITLQVRGANKAQILDLAGKAVARLR
jgi:hypothetical protein